MTDAHSLPTPVQQTSGLNHTSESGSTENDVTVGDAAPLVALLERQRDKYQKLQTLSRTQTQLVQEGQTEPLLRVLAQRQQLVDELAHLHRELEPYRSAWEQVYGRLSETDRGVVSNLIKAVEQLLAEIIEQDQRDQQQLQQSKGQVGESLSQTAHAGHAMAAYNAHHAAGGRVSGLPITDRKG